MIIGQLNHHLYDTPMTWFYLILSVTMFCSSIICLLFLIVLAPNPHTPQG